MSGNESLRGRRVLVTRALEQASALADLLRARGAAPIVVPTIEIVPPEDPAPMRRAIAALPSGADAVVFTSRNGVARTFEELARQGRDARAFDGVKIAAIGPGTAAALAERGAPPHIVASESRGEGLAEELMVALCPRSRVLILRAKVAREVLPEALRAAGHAVEIAPVYETRPASVASAQDLRARFERREIDAVLLTSASTADNLVDFLGVDAARMLEGTVVAAIGDVTRAAAETRKIRVDCTSPRATLEALVDTLAERLSRHGHRD